MYILEIFTINVFKYKIYVKIILKYFPICGLLFLLYIIIKELFLGFKTLKLYTILIVCHFSYNEKKSQKSQ